MVHDMKRTGLSPRHVLGDGRIDLYLPHLSHSGQAIQARASAAEPQYRDLKGPLSGFQITPYLEFFAGAHVNNETLTNTTTSVSEIVPKYSISGLYGRLVLKAQVWLFQAVPT